ncbi:MAG: hypothetical protein LPK85_06315, partial [Gammaproteobacteria bacterium]|nr:hypothetical protein [Gammaproteobacteria bacterium]
MHQYSLGRGGHIQQKRQQTMTKIIAAFGSQPTRTCTQVRESVHLPLQGTPEKRYPDSIAGDETTNSTKSHRSPSPISPHHATPECSSAGQAHVGCDVRCTAANRAWR